MSKRVFQIDQECFIIYAEDLSSPKERFLRIGNSPFLKDFGEELTFLTLLTPLYPGNPFREREIFRPCIDRKIIGLKSYVNDFITFLKNSDIDISNVKVTYAEYAETKNAKVTEEEFIKKIKNDKKLIKHSFASFYLDGNIRIFNRNELFFDLKEKLKESYDERKELEILSSFYLNYYKNSYNKSGIIHSNKSLFIFSNNNFACLSDNSEWIRDAIRVGIDPEKIDFLYLTEDIEPDSLWIKSFLKKWEKNKKIKLVLRKENPNWLNLISKNIVIPIYPERDSVKIDIGDIKLFFQNKRGYILYKNFKLKFEAEKEFLNKGKTIEVEYLLPGNRLNFNLIIDSIENNCLTIYSFNPLIFDEIEENNESIRYFFSHFMASLPVKIKNQIFDKDTDYLDNYLPPFEVDGSFYSRLFLDVVRRAKYENKKISDFMTNTIKTNLKNFNGSEINNNQFVIEQNLYFSKNENLLKIYYSIVVDDMIDIKPSINPFNFFQKERNYEEWDSMMREFDFIVHKIYSKDNKIIKNIKERFENIKKLKEFFIQERKELMEFINIMDTEEKLKREEDNKNKREKLKELLDTKEKILNKSYNDEKVLTNENKDSSLNIESKKLNVKQNQSLKNDNFNAEEILMEKSNKKYNFNKYTNFSGGNNISKTIVIILSILFTILLTVMILFFILYFPYINKYFKTKSQVEYFNSIKKKFNEEKDKPNKVSHYYKFYMTVVDNLRLTNLIAVSNGYHRIAYPFEKRYLIGKDPDWIYPGNILKMPDNSKIIVKDGDTMWTICENYLIEEINRDEIDLRNIIEKLNAKKISMEDAKFRLKNIKENSHSEMVRDFMDKLIKEKDLSSWILEP